MDKARKVCLTISFCTLSYLIIFYFSTDSTHLSRMPARACDSIERKKERKKEKNEVRKGLKS